MQSQTSFRAPARHLCRFILLCATSSFSPLPSSLAAQLPAAPQTTTAPQTPAPQGAAAQATTPEQQAAPRPAHHSQITFEDGLLTVSASNASLNGLIREIARQTGMKISGSVAEDRVFGTYGPADPQLVLATLLDGTGSNILIRSSAADAPLELILTPRTGAPTPPNPNSNLAGNDQDDDSNPPPGTPIAPAATFRGRSSVMPGSTPVSNRSTPSASQSGDNATAAPAAGTQSPDAANDNSTPTGSSGDAAKTPQQIFEQLQRLRQQRSTQSDGTPQ